MTPDERQLITGLFDRMRPAAGQQRDRDAETLIGDQVRAQPYAPYLLAQTVIVQDQALRAANDKIQQLEDQVRKQQPASSQPEDTSFLGGLGRSIFGSGQPDQQRSTVPTTGGHGPAPLPQEPGPYRGQGYPGQGAPAGGPWGQGAAAAAAPAPAGGLFGGGGGGFMQGALGAAAGVAGGVLMADGIRNLFSGGHNPYGIASGFGGGMGGPGGETIVNNYYDSPNQGADSLDYGGGPQDAGDFGTDSFDPGTDGGGFDSGDFGTDV